MPVYEYKVLPAPNRPMRKKGVKGNPGRFAVALEETINEAAADGWEYLRSDSLPVRERQGLMRSSVETYHTVLVFRREARPEVVEDTPETVGLIEDQSTRRTATVAATAAVAAPAVSVQPAEAQPAVPASPQAQAYSQAQQHPQAQAPAQPPLTAATAQPAQAQPHTAAPQVMAPPAPQGRAGAVDPHAYPPVTAQAAAPQAPPTRQVEDQDAHAQPHPNRDRFPT